MVSSSVMIDFTSMSFASFSFMVCTSSKSKIIRIHRKVIDLLHQSVGVTIAATEVWQTVLTDRTQLDLIHGINFSLFIIVTSKTLFRPDFHGGVDGVHQFLKESVPVELVRIMIHGMHTV